MDKSGSSYQDRLLKQLEPLAEQNRDEVIVFAARAALRVFPLIVNAQAEFSFKESAHKHALALFRPLWLIAKNAVVVDYAVDAVDAVDAANVDAAYAAYAAVYATYAAAADADAAGAAVDAITNAAAVDPNYAANDAEIKHDIEWLQKPKSIQYQPLWRKTVPAERRMQLFYQACDQAGLVDVKKVYQCLFVGDKDRLSRLPADLFDAQWDRLNANPEAKLTPLMVWDDLPPPELTHYAPGDAIHNEDVAHQDALDRDGLATAMSTWLTAKQNSSHLALGLFGDWGAGKSTFVNLLKPKLGIVKPISFLPYRWWRDWRNAHGYAKTEAEEQQGKLPVRFYFGEFNAWQYEHSGNIQAGVAQQAVEALTSDMGLLERVWLTLRYAFKQHFWRSFSLALVIFIPLLTLYRGGSLVDKLPDEMTAWFGANNRWLLLAELIAGAAVIATQWKKVLAHPLAKELDTYLRLPNFGKYLGTIPVMREQISVLANLRLKPTLFKRKQRRLLFVIDDLDRCSPEGVVKTLEAVRLVMHLDNVVVLLTIDQKIALAALAKHYQSLSEYMHDKPLSIARDYLGKVVHVPITLQRPSDSDIGNFLDNDLWKDYPLDKLQSELSDEQLAERASDNGGSKPTQNDEITELEVVDEPIEQTSTTGTNKNKVAEPENTGKQDDTFEVNFEKGLSLVQRAIFKRLAAQLNIKGLS